MAFYAVRVWVPDRPGALGAVASRIGAVRGDLIGIDILERGGGRAIDELIVDLPSESLVDLLVAEISEVDGVDVEDVRRASDALADPRLDALETAVSLVTQHAVEPLLARLVRSSLRDFQSDWASIVDPDRAESTNAVGPAPAAAWMQAFLAGSRASIAPRPGEVAPDDVAWADLDTAGLVLILGRQGRPFRIRERRQLTALARIVDTRWAELSGRQPSSAG
ncbi:MAG TPA: hypothetical protein VG435_04385 [Acidimicrobiales bacterium]|jgi:hypothetical protein|nr:hypothetical protein [Acidimicrobiales bacterium]